jgi:hypothetical protein
MIKIIIKERNSGITLASYGERIDIGERRVVLTGPKRDIIFPLADFELVSHEVIGRVNRFQNPIFKNPGRNATPIPPIFSMNKDLWNVYKEKCVEHGWEPTWEDLKCFVQQVSSRQRVAPTYDLQKRPMPGTVFNQKAKEFMKGVRLCATSA